MRPPPSDPLVRTWAAICSELRVAPHLAETWLHILWSHHSALGRYYHDAAHVSSLLAEADAHATALADPTAVRLALIFHNAAYDVHARPNANAGNSTTLFLRWHEAVGLPLGAARQRKVVEWLRYTSPGCLAASRERHEGDDAALHNADFHLFRDIHKAVLAAPWPLYQVHVAAVRRDYGGVPAPVWCYWRLAALRLLRRGPVFTSMPFAPREAAARANLTRELTALCVTFTSDAVIHAATAAAGAAAVSGGGLQTAARALLAAAATVRLGKWALIDRAFVTYPYPHATPAVPKAPCVIFAASFNPPHLGHLEILKHLATVAHQVHAVIGVNPSKTYAVSPEARKELLEAMLAEVGIDLAVVRVVICGEYIWQHGKRIGATVLYRGIRTWRKDGYAEKYLEYLNTIGPRTIAKTAPIPTRYLQAPPQYAHISSTLLRERAVAGAPVDDLVPPAVAPRVLQLYA